jgi:hypothetical protein
MMIPEHLNNSVFLLSFPATLLFSQHVKFNLSGVNSSV